MKIWWVVYFGTYLPTPPKVHWVCELSGYLASDLTVGRRTNITATETLQGASLQHLLQTFNTTFIKFHKL